MESKRDRSDLVGTAIKTQSELRMSFLSEVKFIPELITDLGRFGCFFSSLS